jgi:hypothetical protein
MNQETKVIVTRESVSQADDVFVPHEKTLYLPENCSIGDFTNKILAIRYLTTVAGGRSTWVMKVRILKLQ